MLAITIAFEREIKDYLQAGEFKLVERRDGFRFYLSSAVRDVVVVEGGFGRRKSREASQLVIEKYRPDLMVSAGYAGGVQDGLVPGDVFVCRDLLGLTGEPAYWSADAVLEKAVPESALPYDQWNDIEIRWGTCLTLPVLVSGSSMKEWLGKTFGSDLVDMESYWVSDVAEEHGIPCLIVRAVFDQMEQTMPPFVARSVDGSTARTALRAAVYSISHPASIRGTLAMLTQARQATASLSRFLLNLTTDGAKAPDAAIGVI